MTTELFDCERIAYLGGLAAGLSQALTGTDVAGAAPGRFVAIPIGRVRPGMEVVPHSLAAAEGVSIVRTGAPRSTGAAQRGCLGLLLAAARLGVTRRLADAAIAHLSARTSGGEPLVRKQLVVGSIADILIGVESLRRYLETACGAPSQRSTVDIHDTIDKLDWSVAMLFGASGYIADHPARALYVSALVANIWISREPRDDRA